MKLDKNIIGKIAIWYEDKLNFGINRIIDWNPDGGVLKLEVGMCFDTQLIAIIDEKNLNEYHEPTIVVEKTFLSKEELFTN